MGFAPAKAGQGEHGDTPTWSGSRRLGIESYKDSDEENGEAEDEDGQEDEDEDEDEDDPEDEEAEGAGQVVRWL